MPDTTATGKGNGQNGTGSSSLPQKAKVKEPPPVAPLVTRSTKRKTPAIVTRSNVLPEQDDGKQSVTLGGFLFKRDGVGWECRHVVYVEELATGKRKRKKPYLSHLSRTNYEAMKKKNPTPETLTAALIDWAEAKKKEKGKI